MQILLKILWKGAHILIIGLFTFIAWIIIILFSLIPKTLNILENIIMFFCISIIEINFYTILTLNLSLIQNSQDPKMYIAILINRNIIIPLSFLIFVNSYTFIKEKFKKLGVIVVTLSFLVFMDLFPLHIGMKVYRGWNGYLDTLVTVVFMILFVIIAKKLPDLK